MDPIDARHESGVLTPERPLALRQGELVRLIVRRRPDPRRWDFERLRLAEEHDDDDLSDVGLQEWNAALVRVEPGEQAR